MPAPTENDRQPIKRRKGDNALIPFKVKNNLGVVTDLTGKTVVFQMFMMDAPNTQVITNGACVITNAAAGEGYFAPTVNQMNIPGMYSMYVEDNSNPPVIWPYDGAKWQLHILQPWEAL